MTEQIHQEPCSCSHAHLAGHQDNGRRAERFGSCTMPRCSCSGFVNKPGSEQFCDNCGHSRSSHIS